MTHRHKLIYPNWRFDGYAWEPPPISYGPVPAMPFPGPFYIVFI